MLWINYLDTGGERVDTSLEGSLRMEGWRGGGDEEEVWSIERLVLWKDLLASISLQGNTSTINIHRCGQWYASTIVS